MLEKEINFKMVILLTLLIFFIFINLVIFDEFSTVSKYHNQKTEWQQKHLQKNGWKMMLIILNALLLAIMLKSSNIKMENIDEGTVNICIAYVGIFGILINFNQNKRNKFIEKITSERINWLNNLKEKCAEYITLCRYEGNEMEKDELLCLISFYINHLDDDKDILEKLKKISKNRDFDDVEKSLSIFFKKEWEIIKIEGFGEILTKDEKNRIYNKIK